MERVPLKSLGAFSLRFEPEKRFRFYPLLLEEMIGEEEFCCFFKNVGRSMFGM